MPSVLHLQTLDTHTPTKTLQTILAAL